MNWPGASAFAAAMLAVIVGLFIITEARAAIAQTKGEDHA